MRELTERARQLIDLARREDDPQAGAQARIEQALAARIVSGAGPIRSAATVAKSAAGAGRATAIKALKAMLVGVGAAALVAGTWQVAGSPRAPEQSSAPSSVSAAGHAGAAPLGAAPVEHAASRTPSPVATTAGPSPALHVSRAQAGDMAQPAVAPEGSSAPEQSAPLPVLPPERGKEENLGVTALSDKGGNTASAEPAVDPLHAETQALRTAQRLLRDGSTQQALAQLAQQDVTYRAGALQEERAAARVLALCQGGQAAQAHSEAERFAQRWPRSALLARVLSACRNP